MCPGEEHVMTCQKLASVYGIQCKFWEHSQINMKGLIYSPSGFRELLGRKCSDVVPVLAWRRGILPLCPSALNTLFRIVSYLKTLFRIVSYLNSDREHDISWSDCAV
eukprot:jgi/Botrbrau1/13504/Bobra.0082s0097.1